MEDDYEMFKIVVIGSSGVGKSNIALRFVKGEYKDTLKSTIGVQFLHKILTVNQTKVKVTLWDTAGQEVYRSLSKVYYKGSLGVILVYDVTSQKSYVEVEEWYKLANDNLNMKNVVTMVLGNKIDAIDQKIVPFERVLLDYKQGHNLQCFEVSALTGEGIQQSIMYMIEKIYRMHVAPDQFSDHTDSSNQPKTDAHVPDSVPINYNTIRASIKIPQIDKLQKSRRIQSSSILKLGGSNLQNTSLPKKDKKCSC